MNTTKLLLAIALLYMTFLLFAQSQEDPIQQQNSSWEVLQAEIIFETGDLLQILSTGEMTSGSVIDPPSWEYSPEIVSQTGTTWSLVQEPALPQLTISEVYYDGTEEWIEITNLWFDFSWSITLGGTQTISTFLTIFTKQSIILTKPNLPYARISPLVYQLPLSASFGFTDTKAIDLHLFREDQLLESFQVDTGLVLKYNDKKTSLSKENGIISGSSLAINIQSGYRASPGYFNFSPIPENTSPENNPLSSSWSDSGGGSMSGIVETPIPSSPWSPPLSISEIYLGTWYFSSFIEIKAEQTYHGEIILSGSLLKTALSAEIFLEKDERLIFVYIDNWWLSDQKKSANSALELNFSGFLQIIGQSGQVFDNIQILSTTLNKSVYRWPFSNWDFDIFSKIDNFSPGFDQKFLWYTNQINTGTNLANIQNHPTISQTTSWALSNSWSQTWQFLSESIGSWVLLQPKDLQIIDIYYKTPEYIILRSNIGISLNLSKKDFYLLTKEKSTDARKTSKKYLTGILVAQNYITLYKTWWFLDKGSCVGLFYQTVLLDEYCYAPLPVVKPQTQSTGEELLLTDEIFDQLTIQGLLPNPAGADTQEEIILYRSSDSATGASPIPPKTLALQNGSSKKYFTGILFPNTGTTIKGSLGLTNKASCIQLFNKTTLLDQFCYPNPKEQEYFFTGNTILQTIQKSDLSILQKVWFITTGSKICIVYQNQMLSCRNLPAAKTSIKLKNENKLYKTYVGLLQNYLIKHRSQLYYNTDIKIYFDTLKQAKSQVTKFSSSLSIQGQQFDVYDLSWQIDLQTKPQWLSWNHIPDHLSWWKKILQWLKIDDFS
jgi:hypothetical protein